MVSVAMVLIVIVLVVSIYLVKVKRRFVLHRNIQIASAAVLLVALVVFEVDVRFFTNWRELAAPSPYFESGWVTAMLWVHLCFAIPTPVVWGVVIYFAVRKLQINEQGEYRFPNDHAQWHRRWAWIAFTFLICLAFTFAIDAVQRPWILATEYGGLSALLLWEGRRRRQEE